MLRRCGIRSLFLTSALVILGFPASAGSSPAPAIELDRSKTFRVALASGAPTGEASIREHALAWHPIRKKWYLVADVVPLDNPYHPNTYGTELHLWSSHDMATWTYHGVAVRKGVPGRSYDGYGAASPAGMAFYRGRLYVPFSARRTSRFEQRSIGLAYCGADPEKVPWSKTRRPISDLPGEDDDPAVITVLGDNRLHLFHRRTGPGGYRIVHTSSRTPTDVDSWPTAAPVMTRPASVRAQELTGVFVAGGMLHLFVIEHQNGGGMRIAHLVSSTPNGPFKTPNAQQRYLAPSQQPARLAYGGHITPAARNGTLVALFWTVPQTGRRYGLVGHPARLPLKVIEQATP